MYQIILNIQIQGLFQEMQVKRADVPSSHVVAQHDLRHPQELTTLPLTSSAVCLPTAQQSREALSTVPRTASRDILHCHPLCSYLVTCVSRMFSQPSAVFLACCASIL